MASGHVGKGRYKEESDGTQCCPYLRLKNEFLATWEVAGEAIAHEFVTENTVAFGHAEGHAHEIGESAEL